MAGYKFLIDTNVVIGLEDDKTVDASVADLIRLCSECGVGVFVDGANYDDIRRDKNETRRAVTLSKLEKFRRLHDVPQPSAEVSVQQFGPANSANDQSDVRLLVALTAKAVDFVITQDGGLLKRAGRAGLAKNVLTVEDALGWLRQTYKTVRVVLPDLVEVKAYQIDRSASIFESLRADYDGFDKWFDRCCGEHRDCWLLKIGDHLAGLVVRKDENHAEAQTKHLGPRILKVSTFKVDDKYRGEKFGELLLKQIFWFAQRNRYDLIYLTVFPKHTYLVELLSYYGFEHTLTKSNGEYVMERPMWLGAQPVEVPSAIEFARKSYPRILDGQDARKFCIPIRPDYHRRLFPEIAFVADTPLFPARAFDLRHSPHQKESQEIR